MKKSWFNRKEGHKGFKVTHGTLNKSRKARRDQGQQRTPSIDRCAIMFSQAMMAKWAKDPPVVCARCGRASDVNGLGPLEVSHFFNVRKSSVRFDPNNVDPLHQRCHTGPDGWEYRKGEGDEYEIHMVCKLGDAAFWELYQRGQEHMSLEVAKAEFLERLRGGTL